MRAAVTAPRALVVYYSRTGTTRAVAELVAAALDADVEELRDARRRGTGRLGWLRSTIEVRLGWSTRLQPTRADPRHYDVVVIASPVWWAQVSSPVREWLSARAEDLPSAALLVTLGGYGADRALAQLARLARQTPRAELAVRADAVASGGADEAVAGFVRELRSSMAAARQRG